jgi:hypothetical protein
MLEELTVRAEHVSSELIPETSAVLTKVTHEKRGVSRAWNIKSTNWIFSVGAARLCETRLVDADHVISLRGFWRRSLKGLQNEDYARLSSDEHHIGLKRHF